MLDEDITVPVSALREGDRFHDDNDVHHWTALADAERTEDGSVLVRVLYADGGTGARQWAERDAYWLLTVKRS